VLADYLSLSTGHADGAHAFFAARVYGVDIDGIGRQVDIGGSALATVVPAPATLWLLGTAAGALVPLRRRLRN
jgi:hypothetical protein